MNKVPGTLIVAMMLFVSAATQAAQIWQPIDPGISMRGTDRQPAAYFSVDLNVLKQRLGTAPHQALQDFSGEIELPMPDGSLARFSLVEAPIMQPGLARKFPEIKTYKVFGIDDPRASGRVDISPRGFSGMLHTSGGRVFIDPEQVLDADSLYMARHQDSIERKQEFTCGVHDLDFSRSNAQATRQYSARIPGSFLRYRLAVAATAEYVAAVGPPDTVGNAQAAIVTAINRVNQIYERDLGITLELVANNDQLIENAGNVNLSNTNPFALFLENQCWIDTVVGETGYDIGHVFSTGNGGFSALGSVCSISNKAKGVSGLTDPTGDPFYVDFVAHEIGHQFSAEHSFNGSTGSCGGGNRVGASAMEPGSGSTIMAYAGICSVPTAPPGENLQSNSDATFHARNIVEINAFTAGAGSSCAVQIPAVPANPNDPTINPIADFTIPANTPFELTGSAMDLDGDTLEYQWDQMDAGTATNATTFGTDIGDNPLFRSYPPQPTSTRDFPAMGTQVKGQYDKAEVLPCNDRQMNFRLTARDGKSGQATEDVRIDVAPAAAGTFRVSNYNSTQDVDFNAGPITLTWDVANTHNPPVDCTTVDIELLTFSPGPAYATYSIHPLQTNVANTPPGSVTLAPVTMSHPRARFRVRCSDNNIFYDISDADLNIIGTTAALFDQTGITTFFNQDGMGNDNVTVGNTAPACGNPRPASRTTLAAPDNNLARAALPAKTISQFMPRLDSEIIRNLPASCDVLFPPAEDSSGGGGRDASSFDWAWLLLLAGIAVLRKFLRPRPVH